MRVRAPIAGVVVAIWAFVSDAVSQEFPLGLSANGVQVELSWPTAMSNSVQNQVFPEYQIQYSFDLKSWQSLAGKVKGIPGVSGPVLKVTLDQQQGPAFYRVIGNPNSGATNETGTGGAQVLGYDLEFSALLTQIGQLSVQDFATNGGNISYLPQLTWDPTTAQYWTNFSSTNVYNDSVPDYRSFSSSTNFPYNFLLDADEMAVFKTNGFVVSERLGSASFGDAYYRIFNADLPVFITADSVLHAWHRSYQNMLEELEELELSTLLERVITNMSAQLPETWQQYGNGPLSKSILDADYFLTVARNLWSTQQVASALGNTGVNTAVASTLSAISNQFLVAFPIFGGTRTIDFSQFTVRGHYTDSARLTHYFLTMMWCGRIDLRLVTFPPNKEDDIRQLGTAIVMSYLLNQSNQFTNWLAIEKITRTFAGPTDSMTFAQLADLLANAKIHSPADVPDLLTLTNLQTRLQTGELGSQAIQGDFLYSPLGPEQLKLPRSFTVCGQKFTLDSWGSTQVVFDRLLWSPDYGTNIIFGKVMRRKTSCLDTAFSIFGNDQVVPELMARMTDENGDPFRDGPHLPYQHNLLAVRETIDSQDDSTWSDNIYNAWLAAIRSLSAPTTSSSYPEAMRTRAWAMKTLNTQLASWTELRHDTVAYVKPSYTGVIVCQYPAGFVEPRPEFWQQLELIAETTANAISKLQLSGTVAVYGQVDLANVQSNQLVFLTNFAAQVTTLNIIAQRELAQQPLTAAETNFLKNTIELVMAYANFRQWNGWYPSLYYENFAFSQFANMPDCDMWDAMVTDVHTDPPDRVTKDPGMVLHEGVGNVNLMLIAVDNGPDHMVYAGPVLSHYEFEVPGINRLTDDDWKASILAGQKPPQPPWTTSYLVPGTIPIPPGNR
jgi:hypothetical protein